MSKKIFQLTAPYEPAGDQPNAIAKLVNGIKLGMNRQTLLGVTGSGKTYTMAATIAAANKPALIISHNKTLTAQLTSEFKEFFPNNAVEYFVSYYDYYQPEAYIPRSDTYIAKDAAINDEIDRLRHAAMESILTRKDVVVVASVSCIYGLGDPKDYLDLRVSIRQGDTLSRSDILRRLSRLQYTRNDTDLVRGSFRVNGDIIDVHPAGEDTVLRIELFGDHVDNLYYLDDLTGEVLRNTTDANIFPAKFFLTSQDKLKGALSGIRAELQERIEFFNKQGKPLEAERIAQRTSYDLEMIEQIGYVSGVENYSRHLDGRSPGEPPSTLIDYFRHSYGDKGFLTFIDESHMTVSQVGGMYAGDRSRKDTLVDYGFRLPSAKDNRPLTFSEFEDRVNQTIFVSATPSDFEKNTSQQIVEQIVRPTGLLDPDIEVRPTQYQVDDIIDEIKKRIKNKQRILVTTLTKRMAEELSTYLIESGIKAAYLHGEVETFDRLEVLRNLRLGTYDVLVGINLLREGLDLPEVSLVAIMDADKEGFLRNATSLIQTMGRAARHIDSHVIMYADRVTGSMKQAIDETKRRRIIQEKYNKDNNITPQTIIKKIGETRLSGKALVEDLPVPEDIPIEERTRAIKELTSKMDLAAQNLEFERAAQLRDMIKKIKKSKNSKRRRF